MISCRPYPMAKRFWLPTVCIVLMLYWLHGSLSSPKNVWSRLHSSPDFQPLSCRSLPHTNETLVILKTGSTELQDKLPVHLATTLRCYPDYILFSDYEEVFQGEQVFNALDSIDSQILATHPDFDLYRKLQAQGRTALDLSELSGNESHPDDGGGKSENPGWKLDKWKFLPMVNRTLHEYPDKKWFLFVEADTYILWQTLLNYIAHLDYNKPYYIGAQIWIGDIPFAHGGTGFLVSQRSMQMVVKHYTSNKKEFETFTDGHWAGDCVLGKAFRDAGSPLTYAWPIFQGDDIGNMNFDGIDGGSRLWCQPSVSFHHHSPDKIKAMWNFEQKWRETKGKNSTNFLRHKDLFAEYILPQVTKPKLDWDNHSNDNRGPVSSLEDCHDICQELPEKECRQYAISSNKVCWTTKRPNLGERAAGLTSGWIFDRMQRFYNQSDPCTDETWLT